jgi:hypothetical protein
MINQSWLVQRLHAPQSGPFAALLNMPLISYPEAREVLSQIFSFDYMGSSKFEFGAVPKALKVMFVRHSELRASVVEHRVVPTEAELRSMEFAVTREERRLAACLVKKDKADIRRDLAEVRANIEASRAPQIVTLYVIAPQSLMDCARRFVLTELNSPQRPPIFVKVLSGNPLAKGMLVGSNLITVLRSLKIARCLRILLLCWAPDTPLQSLRYGMKP